MEQDRIIELVTKEFQKFGFKAQNPSFDKNNNDFVFETEDATGMSAFSISTITPSFSIYKDNSCVSLRVSYSHHAGGSNGFRREYIILRSERSFSKEKLTLLPYDIFHQAVIFSEKMSNNKGD